MFTQAAMGLLALFLGVLTVEGVVRLWHVYDVSGDIDLFGGDRTAIGLVVEAASCRVRIIVSELNIGSTTIGHCLLAVGNRRPFLRKTEVQCTLHS